MDSPIIEVGDKKKKFERKVAPSKAPRRLLKKKLRDLERLVKNKGTLKDLPEEVLKDTESKIDEVKKQIEALGPETKPEEPQPKSKNKKNNNKVDGIKSTELRRAGRKIVSFKKQHPNFKSSEKESKEMEELELDLLYIKNFPKNQEYISLYPESPLEESQIKTQSSIRENIAKTRSSGELKKRPRPNTSKSEENSTENQPESNWNDEAEDSDSSNSDEEDGDEEVDNHQTKKQKN
ncbi:hypothetical protein BGZ76_011195 [Entomortierella beljakovae]|nr:hypothetical protein BGZ76_011195 [Entomortierella beljakovae]